MENKKLGESIAALRQAMGATQEDLAQSVGVSAQAVSKWECGGLPDAALLPGIADFLGVPIDRLYGRAGVGGDIYEALRLRVGKMAQEDRMREGMRICFELQKALCGAMDNRQSITELWEKQPHGYHHSQMLFNSGVSLMSITADAPYYALLTEPPEGWEKGLFSAEAYAELFAVLGGKQAMQALFFLLRRGGGKPFTPRLLEKALGIAPEQALAILKGFARFKLVSSEEAELDDAVQTIYDFKPNPALLALLAIGKEVMQKPGSFIFNCVSRNTPYFVGG
ncbi:MAG: helix-turn-helix domain-containing protein [Oscillospiraceae bacterium]|nr:helix-turn-helix domain-containing protein [Oscillospiraceae bacterium]